MRPWGVTPRGDAQEAAGAGLIRLAYVDRNPALRGGPFQLWARWLSGYGWLLFGLLSLLAAGSARRRPGFGRSAAWPSGRFRPAG